MQCAVGIDEDERLNALRNYNVLDIAPEDAFDRITRIAKMILGTPIVLISLVDDDRQWFKSRQGLDATETSRDISFCTHTIMQDMPFIVEDAREHPLFYDNPLVTGEPYIRFYIGIPLTVAGGHKIGTLCAIDRQPRQLSPAQIEVFGDLASLVVDQLELRQIAVVDTLTGALTRHGFEIEINREMKRAKRYKHSLSLIMIDVDHFKTINDRYGHAAGDAVLRKVVSCIKRELRNDDFIGRLGGDEFVIALPETAISGAESFAERIRQRIADTFVYVMSDKIAATVSLGITTYDRSDRDVAGMLARADAGLYKAKTEGRNLSVAVKDSLTHFDAA
jgi:diguanylate cyclase (GGDEF)-like protein